MKSKGLVNAKVHAVKKAPERLFQKVLKTASWNAEIFTTYSLMVVELVVKF